MDPVQNIKRQIELANEIINGQMSGEPVYSEDDVIDLAELVIALHEHRVAGGEDPYDLTETGGVGSDEFDAPAKQWFR